MHNPDIRTSKRKLAMVALVATTVIASAASSFAQETRVLVKDGRVLHWSALGKGYIGVDVLPLTSELREHFGVPSDVGVLVSRLEEGAPGEAAGIVVGDVLTAVDGESVTDTRRLARAIRKKEAGDTVTIELWRDGSVNSLPVTVAERERPVFDVSRFRFMPGTKALPPDGHDYTYAAPGFEFHFDDETMGAFESAMKQLEERIDSGEWRESLERLDTLDFGAIQDRMEEVEKRLRELEDELAAEKEKNRDEGEGEAR